MLWRHSRVVRRKGTQVDKLPGVETLDVEGTRDGQTKVVREGTEGVAYQWSTAEARWVKVGTVVQGSGGQELGKKMYDGRYGWSPWRSREYDLKA